MLSSEQTPDLGLPARGSKHLPHQHHRLGTRYPPEGADQWSQGWDAAWKSVSRSAATASASSAVNRRCRPTHSPAIGEAGGWSNFDANTAAWVRRSMPSLASNRDT